MGDTPKIVVSRLLELLERPDFPEGRCWQRRQYAPNAPIVTQGQAGHEVFVLLEGTVRVTATVELEGGRTIRPGFCDLAAGAVFGELCLFDEEPRSASVVALTECQVAAIPRDTLRGYLEANPGFGYAVLGELILLLVARLRTANRRFAAVFSWGLKVHGIDKLL